jgi:hypothetical protein
MPPGAIRTHNLIRRAAEDLCLRPRGHCDRHLLLYTFQYYSLIRNNNHITYFNTQIWRPPTLYTVPFMLLQLYLVMAETCCRRQKNAWLSNCCVNSGNKTIYTSGHRLNEVIPCYFFGGVEENHVKS